MKSCVSASFDYNTLYYFFFKPRLCLLLLLKNDILSLFTEKKKKQTKGRYQRARVLAQLALSSVTT